MYKPKYTSKWAKIAHKPRNSLTNKIEESQEKQTELTSGAIPIPSPLSRPKSPSGFSGNFGYHPLYATTKSSSSSHRKSLSSDSESESDTESKKLNGNNLSLFHRAHTDLRKIHKAGSKKNKRRVSQKSPEPIQTTLSPQEIIECVQQAAALKIHSLQLEHDPSTAISYSDILESVEKLSDETEINDLIKNLGLNNLGSNSSVFNEDSESELSELLDLPTPINQRVELLTYLDHVIASKKYAAEVKVKKELLLLPSHDFWVNHLKAVNLYLEKIEAGFYNDEIKELESILSEKNSERNSLSEKLTQNKKKLSTLESAIIKERTLMETLIQRQNNLGTNKPAKNEASKNRDNAIIILMSFLKDELKISEHKIKTNFNLISVNHINMLLNHFKGLCNNKALFDEEKLKSYLNNIIEFNTEIKKSTATKSASHKKPNNEMALIRNELTRAEKNLITNMLEQDEAKKIIEKIEGVKFNNLFINDGKLKRLDNDINKIEKILRFKEILLKEKESLELQLARPQLDSSDGNSSDNYASDSASDVPTDDDEVPQRSISRP